MNGQNGTVKTKKVLSVELSSPAPGNDGVWVWFWRRDTAGKVSSHLYNLRSEGSADRLHTAVRNLDVKPTVFLSKESFTTTYCLQGQQ